MQLSLSYMDPFQRSSPIIHDRTGNESSVKKNKQMNQRENETDRVQIPNRKSLSTSNHIHKLGVTSGKPDSLNRVFNINDYNSKMSDEIEMKELRKYATKILGIYDPETE